MLKATTTMLLLKQIKYATFLLFQYRVVKNNRSNKRRICEERIYHIYCNNAEEAYSKSIEIGKNEEFNYKDGNKHIYFEFIGILDIIELEIFEDKNLVWDRFIEKVEPMERKDKIIPKKNKLSIFNNKGRKIKL